MKRLTLKEVGANVFVGGAIFLCRDLLGGAFASGVFAGGFLCLNPYFVSVCHLASAAVCGLDDLFAAAVRVAVFLAARLACRAFKRKMNFKIFCLAFLPSNLFYFIYKTESYSVFFDKAAVALVAFASSAVCFFAFRALFVRGLKYRLATDEVVCVALFSLVVSYCLATLKLPFGNALTMISVFALLCCFSVFGGETTFVASAVMGMAAVFAEGRFDLFAYFVCVALAVCVAHKINRYVAAGVAVLVDVLFARFFNVYGAFDVFTLIPSAVGALVFALVPTKFLSYISDVYGNRREKADRAVVNKISLNVSRKLFRLSDVFFAMQNTFLSMTKETVSKEQARIAMIKQVAANVCGDCKERSNCWRVNLSATEKNMTRLAEVAVNRGKITILDVPPTLSVRCNRLSGVLSAFNGFAETYVAAAKRQSQADAGRALLGEQLGGISKIIGNIAADCRGKISFDTAIEKELVEQLNFHNVKTGDAVFVEQGGDLSVVLTVAKNDFDEDAICKVTSSIVRRKMLVEKTETAEGGNWLAVYLSAEPRFGVSYGVRSAPKYGSEISGDTHSFLQIDSGKYLLAVCDGMGSGENAEKTSETAISLVENFYKAGFDSDVILSAVNKLLGSVGGETFTAVDVCVIDRATGLADFIKLGACTGLVKSGGEVQYVSGSSLPLGVLEEMKPSVTTKALHCGDLVVLMSDGVWDGVEDPAVLATYLDKTVLTNPQIIADELLEMALSRAKGKPKDDMTVVVARLTD